MKKLITLLTLLTFTFSQAQLTFEERKIDTTNNEVVHLLIETAKQNGWKFTSYYKVGSKTKVVFKKGSEVKTYSN